MNIEWLHTFITHQFLLARDQFTIYEPEQKSLCIPRETLCSTCCPPLQQCFTAFQFSHALFLFMMTMLLLVITAHLKRKTKNKKNKTFHSLGMSVEYEKGIQSHLPRHVNKSLTDILTSTSKHKNGFISTATLKQTNKKCVNKCECAGGVMSALKDDVVTCLWRFSLIRVIVIQGTFFYTPS